MGHEDGGFTAEFVDGREFDGGCGWEYEAVLTPGGIWGGERSVKVFDGEK